MLRMRRAITMRLVSVYCVIDFRFKHHPAIIVPHIFHCIYAHLSLSNLVFTHVCNNSEANVMSNDITYTNRQHVSLIEYHLSTCDVFDVAVHRGDELKMARENKNRHHRSHNTHSERMQMVIHFISGWNPPLALHSFIPPRKNRWHTFVFACHKIRLHWQVNCVQRPLGNTLFTQWGPSWYYYDNYFPVFA